MIAFNPNLWLSYGGMGGWELGGNTSRLPVLYLCAWQCIGLAVWGRPAWDFVDAAWCWYHNPIGGLYLICPTNILLVQIIFQLV